MTPQEFLDDLPYAESNPADGFVGSPYYSDGRYSSIDPAPLADYCNALCGTLLCADISGYSVEDVRRELLAGNYIVAYQTFWWKPVSYADFSSMAVSRRWSPTTTCVSSAATILSAAIS